MSIVIVNSVTPGKVVKVRGVEYRLIRRKTANYLVERCSDGATFNLRLTSPVEVVENADEGFSTTPKVPTFTATPMEFLSLAQEVKITGHGSGRYEGSVGYVAKVNAKTYGVLIPNKGIVTASRGLVTAV